MKPPLTGSELRALLVEWHISLRVFADELAVRGYAVMEATVKRWQEAPKIPADLVEEWRANPEKRPGRKRKGH
jgi:transposase-like protein